MKKENRVYLAAIRRDMQARLNFPTREERNKAFETLWYGWVKKNIRKHGGYDSVYRLKWIRAYISTNEAASFWDYICE